MIRNSDLLLASDSIWETNIWPAVHKEMSRLDNVVIENLKNYKDQSNEAISSDPNLILVVLIYLAVLATPYQ